MGMPVRPALTLAIIAAVLTALVVLVASFTRDRIASNEQAWICLLYTSDAADEL